jgi:superfamily II RNA helicase
MNLQHLSERLPRVSGMQDVRVRDFYPDPWQRQLLDFVDSKRSAVVVAPTSAGKTFIQYYAMEQVLRESDMGVLVYVCPTKALCNQVVAGVSARFGEVFFETKMFCHNKISHKIC